MIWLTLLRFIILLFESIILYQVLIYLNEWKEPTRLRIRKYRVIKQSEKWKEKIKVIYYLVIALLLLLCLMFIKVKIRGALW